jgi:3-oxoacyl-[acyl-carrier protein] reductase
MRDRLTAAKESGATMEIDGKKIALGVPGAGNRSATTGPTAYPLIPLGRGATPDEAASAMLL